MGDSMTDFIAGVEAADEHRDIDADFAHLREIMGPYYICDYPPRQELIEEFYQYVLCDIHMGARFKGVHWQDVYGILSDAICELIVNAIMHCSYNYSSIQIVIYDNRLEITSPERLPMGRPLNA